MRAVKLHRFGSYSNCTLLDTVFGRKRKRRAARSFRRRALLSLSPFAVSLNRRNFNTDRGYTVDRRFAISPFVTRPAPNGYEILSRRASVAARRSFARELLFGTFQNRVFTPTAVGSRQRFPRIGINGRLS